MLERTAQDKDGRMEKPAPDRMTNDQVRAMVFLEEFKMMRQEIAVRVNEIYRLVYVYIAFVLVLSVACGFWLRQSWPLLAVAVASPLFAFNHISRDREIRRLGMYIGIHLKPEMEKLLQGVVGMRWELENTQYYTSLYPRVLHKINPIAIFFGSSLPATLAVILLRPDSPSGFAAAIYGWLTPILIALAVAHAAWIIFWLTTDDAFEEYDKKGEVKGLAEKRR
jgi:hypothetical protein